MWPRAEQGQFAEGRVSTCGHFPKRSCDVVSAGGVLRGRGVRPKEEMGMGG